MYKLVLTDDSTGAQLVWVPATEAQEVEVANAVLGLSVPLTASKIDAIDRSDVAS